MVPNPQTRYGRLLGYRSREGCGWGDRQLRVKLSPGVMAEPSNRLEICRGLCTSCFQDVPIKDIGWMGPKKGAEVIDWRMSFGYAVEVSEFELLCRMCADLRK